MKIGFVGLGKLGEPCAFKMAESGKHQVTGYDVNFKLPTRVKNENTLVEAVAGKDIVFIAVPTPHDPEYDGKDRTSHLPAKDFDYTILKQTVLDVMKATNDSTLVVLISTVIPGTIRRELSPIIGHRRFLYNPYLIAMGSVEYDMLNPEMVIIGADQSVTPGYDHNVDVSFLIGFYRTIMMNSPRYEVGTWEEAESIKIFYNTWISTKIALVNMMQDVAERLGNIDVDVVTGALAKSTYRITGDKYMTAGLGDGGACHPRDNIALRSLSENLDLGYDMFYCIMDARERQAYNMAQSLVSYGLPVVIVGKTYKPGVPYSAGSVSILTGEFVKQLSGRVFYIDNDNCDDERDNTAFDNKEPAVYLLAHSNNVTYDGKLDTAYELNPIPGSIIVDPWRRNLSIPGCKVVNYGNTRQTF